jgi:hypothetical protein
MTDYPVATKISDFNETEYKQFATRVGDRWSFSLPYSEMENLEDLLPDHVLGIEIDLLEPSGAIMAGKLIPKQ